MKAKINLLNLTHAQQMQMKKFEKLITMNQYYLYLLQELLP